MLRLKRSKLHSDLIFKRPKFKPTLDSKARIKKVIGLAPTVTANNLDIALQEIPHLVGGAGLDDGEQAVEYGKLAGQVGPEACRVRIIAGREELERRVESLLALLAGGEHQVRVVHQLLQRRDRG